MTMIAAYAAAAIVFLIVDLIWLAGVAKSFYQTRLKGLLLEKPNLGAAAVFYAGYIAAIVFFAVRPALAAESATVALAHGALFGLAAYGTYDLTNLATLKGYPARVAIVDMIWGTILTGIAALAGFFGAGLSASL